MRRNYTYFYLWMILIVSAISINFSFAYGGKLEKDTTYMHSKKLKKVYLKNGLPFALPPVKPGNISYAPVKFTTAKADDKLLNDIEVYPNPVTDQLNLKFTLSRNSNVNIKVMDVLGNEVLTVFAQRVDMGEQKVSYPIGNKLSRGFYFIRFAAGTESVIKRISVL